VDTLHPNFGQTYRLSRAALQLREFTVSQLKAVTGVEDQAVHGFVHALEAKKPGSIKSKDLPTASRGRPRRRYSLTSEGVEFLLDRCAHIASQLGESTQSISSNASTEVSEPSSTSHEQSTAKHDEDVEVVRSALRGDMDRLIELNQQQVYFLCLRMVGNPEEALDLTQEAFLHAFRRLSQFRGETSLQAWMHRIAVHVVLKHLRRKSHFEPSPDPTETADFAAVEGAKVRIRRSRALGFRQANSSALLTISSFDPFGVTGVTADLETMATLGYPGVAAISTYEFEISGVPQHFLVPSVTLQAQIKALSEGVKIAVVKIGRVGSRENADAIVELVEPMDVEDVVLDLAAEDRVRSHAIDAEALRLAKERLLSRVTVIVPDVLTAGVLTGVGVQDVSSMKIAAMKLVERGAHAAIIRNMESDVPVTVVFDGRDAYEIPFPKGVAAEGASRSFSSAFAAHLAGRDDFRTAVMRANSFAARAIENYALTNEEGRRVREFYGMMRESRAQDVFSNTASMIQRNAPPKFNRLLKNED
jgi:hydroxymethylpyrimidine kinase/phosphomethylpyrimidine kinase